MKIILSEGSSLTARETLTALHGCGYEVDILSSSGMSIAAFSCWKRRTIRTVNLNREPEQYLRQVSKLLEYGEYITVLPTHEEAWMFAEAKQHLPEAAQIGVAAAEAFGQVQGKISFARVADEIGIPCPPWQLVGEDMKLSYPCWMKANYGTAGRSVYKVNEPEDIARGIAALDTAVDQLMLQEHIGGKYGQVQAIFDRGTMIAVHTTMQEGVGAGGSAAARVGVDYPETREHIDRLGSYLGWHGSITLDFIYMDGAPYYIECNPRMIEPANAALSSVNFARILIELSVGKNDKCLVVGRPGVKTHSTIALLLGTAEQTCSRRAILKTLCQCITKTGPRTNSTEVLTPVLRDPLSIIPTLAILFQLLISPKKVKTIASAAVENYCVLPSTICRLKQGVSRIGSTG